MSCAASLHLRVHLMASTSSGCNRTSARPQPPSIIVAAAGVGLGSPGGVPATGRRCRRPPGARYRTGGAGSARNRRFAPAGAVGPPVEPAQHPPILNTSGRCRRRAIAGPAAGSKTRCQAARCADPQGGVQRRATRKPMSSARRRAADGADTARPLADFNRRPGGDHGPRAGCRLRASSGRRTAAHSSSAGSRRL